MKNYPVTSVLKPRPFKRIDVVSIVKNIDVMDIYWAMDKVMEKSWLFIVAFAIIYLIFHVGLFIRSIWGTITF